MFLFKYYVTLLIVIVEFNVTKDYVTNGHVQHLGYQLHGQINKIHNTDQKQVLSYYWQYSTAALPMTML